MFKIKKLTFTNISLFIFAALTVIRMPESYSVQPAYSLYILIPLYFLFTQKKTRITKETKIIITLFFCFAIINTSHFILDNEPISKLPLIIYWILASILIISLTGLEKQVYLTYINYVGFWVIISILFACIEFYTSFPVRASGLSGTPNNLASSIVHLIVIQKILHIKELNIYYKVLGAVNLSRSYVVFMIAQFFSNRKSIYLTSILLFIAVTFSSNIILNDELISFLDSRFSFSENSSDESNRGLNRILIYPEMFIFGAGDLKTIYQNDAFQGQIHNNFIALSFCFGIPGVIFSIFLIKKLKESIGTYSTVLYLIYSLGLYYYNNIFFMLLIASLIISTKKTKGSV